MTQLHLEQLPRFRALLRRHFLAGLLVVLPLGAALWVVIVALRTLWGLLAVVPAAWRPENWLPSPVLALLVDVVLVAAAAMLLALGVSLLGWVSSRLLGQKMLDFIAARVIERIPVVRSIYSALDQLLRAMALGGGQQFSRVVYLEYPRKGLWTLAFVTGPAKGPAAPADHLNVFVPTTPNPTSGFHLLVPASEVRESQLSVEEAFRTLLSLGIAQPETAPTAKGPATEPERGA